MQIESNPYNCLPNYIAAMSAADLAKPICAAGNSNGCAVAGIEQYTNSNEVSVYPNPASTSLTLTLSKAAGEATIYIYDMLWKLVMQHTYSPPLEGQGESISISDLAEGVYTISITSNEGVVNKRLVIVR